MSAMWTLALGASIGYLAFKRQAVEGRLTSAIKEWEGSGADVSEPQAPNGANFHEIKQAWKYTEDTRNLDFNERLPKSDRAPLLAAEDAHRQEVQQWDRAVHPDQGPQIEGIYLETAVPF